MDNFCVWGPWVFAITAGIIGWVLRAFYDRSRIANLKNEIEIKASDIYHLNEAHTLLQKDKESKLTALNNDVQLKEKIISELKREVNTLKVLSSSSLSTIPSTDKSTQMLQQELDPNSIVAIIDKKAREKNEPTAQRAKGRVATTQQLKTSSDDLKTGLSKKQALKKKLRKRQRRISQLILERNQMLKEIETLKSSRSSETVIKTILIKEKIDKKKIKKILKNLPIKRTKKVLKRKK